MPLRLTNPQHVFLNELKTPFRAFVAGFGAGKTRIGATDLLLHAGAFPGLRQGYFAPTYRDIRDTFYPTVEEVAHSLGFTISIKKADKEVHLYRAGFYYGVILCRSMDNPAAIVGFNVARSQVDEIDTLPIKAAREAWNKIIARNRIKADGVMNGAAVTTTPEGFRFVYDRFKRHPRSRYSMVQGSTYENEHNLPADYIPGLLETYEPQIAQAYIGGEFINLTSGTVYRNYDRAVNASRETIRPNEALHIGQDFNVNKMASVINVERPDGVETPPLGWSKGDQNGWHVVGELKNLRDTPHVIETIKERFADRAIYVYPDASAGSTSSKGASESDLKLLDAAGFIIKSSLANPRVKDRVLSVNTAYSRQKLWVNELEAPTFAEAQEQQAYDDNGEPDKKAGYDHHNDAEGYFVYKTMPVRKPRMETRELRL